MPSPSPVVIATRGSALALAQATQVLETCRAQMPGQSFEIKVVKTTGDELQTAPESNLYDTLPKGMFTREIEEALLSQQADLAVHSLKDLPTELPRGLKLGGVLKRADVRDVLIYRDAETVDWQRRNETSVGWQPGQGVKRGFVPKLRIQDLAMGAIIATSSHRRASQAQAIRPDLRVVPIRGNVTTRLQKLADQPDLDALILAAAGLHRLQMVIDDQGALVNNPGKKNPGQSLVPFGILAQYIPIEEMLPCPGQGAIGIEIRAGDKKMDALCQKLNDPNTLSCVEAERALLQALGGGCQTPIGAYAEIVGGELFLRGVALRGGKIIRAEGRKPLGEAKSLGEEVGKILK